MTTAHNPWHREGDPEPTVQSQPSPPSGKPTEATASPAREVPLSPEDQRALKKAFGYDPDDDDVKVTAGVVSVPVVGRRLTREDISKMSFAEITENVNRVLKEIDAGRIILSEEVTAAETTTSAERPPVVGRREAQWRSIELQVIDTMADVLLEVRRSVLKHGFIRSPHEGYAILKEEVEELWDEIKADGGGRDDDARKEAIQVAAMAVKYAVNLIDQPEVTS